MITIPPIQDLTLNRLGRFNQSWVLWFQGVWRALTGQEPFPLAMYTVLTLPGAIANTGHLIFVTDDVGGPTPAYSDGANWRRTDTGAIIS